MSVEVYPCVIIPSRYGGTYSGGTWLAFNAHEEPGGATSGDNECADFFDDADQRMPIGRGETPNEALADLAGKVKKWRQRS
jgi:hypothetical protein